VASSEENDQRNDTFLFNVFFCDSFQ